MYHICDAEGHTIAKFTLALDAYDFLMKWSYVFDHENFRPGDNPGYRNGSSYVTVRFLS